MMIALYIIGGIVLLVIVLTLISPSKLDMERSVTVSTGQEETWNYLRSLKNFDRWSPWAGRDPNQETGYRGNDGEVGSVSWWKGNKDVGEGEQEVMKLKPYDYIETELRFLKPFKATNTAYYKLSPDGSGTRVTWGFHGKFGFPMRLFLLFMSMEKSLGPDYEKGLAKLKTLIESQPQAGAAAEEE